MEIRHKLIAGKHPIILLGFQPSVWWCRISQPYTKPAPRFFGKKHVGSQSHQATTKTIQNHQYWVNSIKITIEILRNPMFILYGKSQQPSKTCKRIRQLALIIQPVSVFPLIIQPVSVFPLSAALLWGEFCRCTSQRGIPF